jgi:hypothetical protein
MVIGPISLSEWETLLMFKSSIAYMKDKDYNKFQKAIKKETLIYNSMLYDLCH